MKNHKVTAGEGGQWAEEFLKPLETLPPHISREYAGWMTGDPRHPHEIVRALACMQVQASERAEDVRAAADEGASWVNPMGTDADEDAGHSSEVRASRGVTDYWVPRAVFLVIAIAIPSSFLLLLRGSSSPEGAVYRTQIGEERFIKLEDGTVLHLGPNSVARVLMSPVLRDVELDAGSASFNVGQDATRPFRVGTFSALIEALATKFSVDLLDHEQIDVSVSEGRVLVTADRGLGGSRVLGARERVRLRARGTVFESLPEVVVSAKRDSEPRLIDLGNGTLGEIANEFNRGEWGLRLIIEGRARQEKIGLLVAKTPEALLEALEGRPGLIVIRGDGVAIVRHEADSAK